jgi:hypothetical protein
MTAMPLTSHAGLKTRVSPELELLLCSLRQKNPENVDRMTALVAGELNWSEVLAYALEHKVIPTLYERVHELDLGLIPKEKREALAELAHIIAKNNFVFLSEMLRLNRLFESAQISAIPFKGPALALLAYPNFAQRTCVDLDFVVSQSEIPNAAALLQSEGYVPQFSVAEMNAGRHGPAPGQYAFAPNERPCYLELHTERTLRYFSKPLDLEEVNSRLLRLEIGGQTLRTFSVEDLLVMLCVHGAKHFWERLAWIVDIAHMVTVREVNWDFLLETADDLESMRLLLLGLYLAHEMVGAALPPSVLEQCRRDKRVQWLAQKVILSYTDSSASINGVWPRAIFRLRSSDRFLRGLRHLVRLSTKPTESDRQSIQLPGYLAPLYRVFRPFRLLREYGLGLINRRAKTDLAIYLPTPANMVQEMLRLAQLGPEDILYDLGCGDGRIVVAAAKKFGIRAVGVDINPARIAEARANARHDGVGDRVQFILGDAKKVDFNKATVVTMYLGADANLRLVDRLRSELRPGARIISRDFPIYGWEADHTENHVLSNGAPTALYLWVIKNQDTVVSSTATDSVTGNSSPR